MITYVTGDLFLSPAQVLVNTVNTVGVMGKGVAYEFKRIFPEMFEQYQKLCEAGKIQIGDLWLYKSPNKWVLNFPTKKHWRSPSHPAYIEAGLKRFTEIYSTSGIHSIAFPPLGCGNGELDFDTQVAPLMEKYLRSLPIHVFIYPNREDPYIPEHVKPDEFRDWLRTQPEALPFAEVWADLRSLLSKERNFYTTSSRTEFSAKISGDETIQIETRGRVYNIAQEVILSFWQQLRSFGFSSRHIAPSLDRNLSYVIPIFLELPYIKLVRLSNDYSGSGPSVLGLQYVPALETRGNSYSQQSLPLF